MSELLADVDHLGARLTPESYGSDDLLFWLVAKIPQDVWDECWATAVRKARPSPMRICLYLYRSWRCRRRVISTSSPTALEEGTLGTMAVGIKDLVLDKRLPPKNACYMSNVQDLFWCDTRDEQGGVAHALDCDQHLCFVVQGKKQETNTCGTAKMPTTTGVPSPVPSVASASTTRMSAITSSVRPRMAVEAVKARAMASRAMGSPKDEAKAKGKNKAKVEDAEAVTRSTGTRARTGPGGTPTLHQGGQTLSPLESSKTRGLRPVRKSHCHVFLGGLDPGQAPLKTLLLMPRLI